MNKDIRITGADLSFQEIETRVPLKFGSEVTKKVTCARASVTVRSDEGKRATGWGETPLSVAWVWPSELPYAERNERLKRFCARLLELWRTYDVSGHAMEIGYRFMREILLRAWHEENEGKDETRRMPYLAALVCNSLFDLALHDAYGECHEVPTFNTFNSNYMNRDLSWYYTPEYKAQFSDKYPEDYLVARDRVPEELTAWHLVGAKDALEEADLTGDEPQDGYPVLLRDWIHSDGLRCLKIKLTGLDPDWDYDRIVRVGSIALKTGVAYLSTDFNCMVQDPDYVCALLDRVGIERPEIYSMILYIEQPFPYDMEKYPLDVSEVSRRKPLFMDESAHDWRYVSLGLARGWTGVALKTCKTMTGALLAFCWAKEHGMQIMVQDLTNPMLAQIPHVLLAANVGTIMGVETNAMQFYPEASKSEERIHADLYRRRNGSVSIASLGKTGFGYRINDILGRGATQNKHGRPRP
jgi:L-alanine-DL-glutamate epimerase-like enolase superfamily enzyme